MAVVSDQKMIVLLATAASLLESCRLLYLLKIALKEGEGEGGLDSQNAHCERTNMPLK